MKRTILLAVLLVFVISGIFHMLIVKGAPAHKNLKISNGLYSFNMPAKTKNLYTVRKKGNTVFIYHKESQDKGFGGFVFSINAFRNPAEYANIPGNKKLGELTDRKGRTYDIVVLYPNDVQYDYINLRGAQNTYKLLRESVNSINIKNVSGTKYYKNRGVKGENLYDNILKKHINAIQEYWSVTKLENEKMSPLYNTLAQNNSIKQLLNTTGYAYYDINGDGIDELLIGETTGNLNSIIYDIYTMVNRKPHHVVSSGHRNKFFICNNKFICDEYTDGVNKKGLMVFSLARNSSELLPQADFRYDFSKNSNNPCFVSFGNDISKNKYDNVSQKVFNEKRYRFGEYKQFYFNSLSTKIKI